MKKIEFGLLAVLGLVAVVTFKAAQNTKTVLPVSQLELRASRMIVPDPKVHLILANIINDSQMLDISGDESLLKIASSRPTLAERADLQLSSPKILLR